MAKRQNFNLDSEFYCTNCGKKQLFTVPRRNGQGREAGHLKKMFCFNCNKDWNFAEVKPYTKYDYQDFCLEFKYNNFDKEGNRKLKYGLFRDKIHSEGVDLYEEIDIDGSTSRSW